MPPDLEADKSKRHHHCIANEILLPVQTKGAIIAQDDQMAFYEVPLCVRLQAWTRIVITLASLSYMLSWFIRGREGGKWG